MLRSDIYFLFPVEKKKNPKEKHDWEKNSTMRSVKFHGTKKYPKSTSFQESAAAAAYFQSF